MHLVLPMSQFPVLIQVAKNKEKNEDSIQILDKNFSPDDFLGVE